MLATIGLALYNRPIGTKSEKSHLMCQHRAGWGPCRQWAGFPASPPQFGWETPPSHHAHMSAAPSLPACHRTAALTGAHFFLWPELLPAHATNVNGASLQHGHGCCDR